ncbi:MAG: S-adenosylmethionine decarboxylase [Patescibacteria group bacterium]|nr:S-adenosylmethionine decarboxylase [Patescibacteria group bacterium]MDD5490397.1 S-adenosylmethionine decarboxylase [Patescibacteria group bacterium]
MAKEHRVSSAVPSFVYLATVQVCDVGQIINKDNLRKFVDKLCEAIEMRKMRQNPIVDELPSEIFGVKSYSVSQPLMTSILSLDTWPEEDSFVLLIHSCKEFDPQIVANTITEFFKGAKIFKESFIDRTLRKSGSQ